MLKKAFSKQNRALLSELVRTDFKLRYQGSVLGYLWSILKPLMLFAILYVVFVKFLRIGNSVPHYPIYLLFGIVVWTFFAELTGMGLTSIVGRGDLIRKIRIPRWIIVLSSSISALINLGINMVIVLIFLFINKVDLLVTSVWVPILLFEIFILGLGVSLWLSALYVKYRDITHIWEVILQAGFYVTPILYPLSIITNINFQKILLLNPVAQVVQDSRYAMITHQTVVFETVYSMGIYRMIPIIICLSVFASGVIYFKKEAKDFAENI